MQSVYCVKILSLSFLLASTISACADDEMFGRYQDDWCERYQCQYHVVEGDIKQVPTWNQSDYGIELVGSMVEIEHTRDALERTSYSDGDIALEMIAYVEPSAQVTLEIDYWDDGYIDCAHKIGENNWESLRLTLHGPSDFESIRFVVRKQGKGRVVIARLKPWPAYANDPRDQVVICESNDYKAPIGYPCDSDDECVSGKCSPTVSEEYQEYFTQQCNEGADNRTYFDDRLCEENISLRCSECTNDSDCPEGDICGLRTDCDEGRGCLIDAFDVISRGVFRECMSPRLHGTGHSCYKDSECTSGFCATTFGTSGIISSPFLEVPPQTSLCHECRTDSDCDSERVCGFFREDFEFIARCVDPGSDSLGEVCLSDSECAEGLFCMNNICVECDQNAACENGLLCSYTHECIEPRTLALGEPCENDDVCESGICTHSLPPPPTEQTYGWCSECAEDSDCESGQSCVDSYVNTEEYYHYPICWPRE